MDSSSARVPGGALARDDDHADQNPVYVIESIPVGGANEISTQEIKSEGIPTPPHLRLYPELGRGGMGRIHPATDRNLLRHVALKRLAKELVSEPFYRDGFVAEAQITVHGLALDLGPRVPEAECWAQLPNPCSACGLRAGGAGDRLPRARARSAQRARHTPPRPLRSKATGTNGALPDRGRALASVPREDGARGRARRSAFQILRETRPTPSSDAIELSPQILCLAPRRAARPRGPAQHAPLLTSRLRTARR